MERVRRSIVAAVLTVLFAACSQHDAVPSGASFAPQRLPGPPARIFEYRVPSRYKPLDRILISDNGAIWYTGGFAGIVRFKNQNFASPHAPPYQSYAGNFQNALATDGNTIFGSDGWASSKTLVGGFNVAAIGPIGRVAILGGGTCSPGGPYLEQMGYDRARHTVWAILQNCQSSTGLIFTQPYPGTASQANVLTLPGSSSGAIAMALGERYAYVYGFTNFSSSANYGIFQISLESRQVTNFYEMPPLTNAANMIVLGDGSLWFTDPQNGSVDRMSAGVFTQYHIPGSNPEPYGIARGCDAALWFTEENANAIGRMTTRGVFSSYPLARGNYAPQGIVADLRDCSTARVLWFTQLGRLGKVLY